MNLFAVIFAVAVYRLIEELTGFDLDVFADPSDWKQLTLKLLIYMSLYAAFDQIWRWYKQSFVTPQQG
ncbi:hypothetical protein Q4491_19960 [Photobacterium sp. 2_MG-2023]|uniref:hypothetical protein n=1 Tax=Photobacterium TaxID=657 RepID=UPI001C45E7F2|nr:MULTISPECIES: hypothetical protein [Photobacterium]MBV7263483.1 hypothetical protein [Photobacterium sp. WH24]MDO6583621.1 hypothetical protein [Photobacterium sp. 2_MG-2023]